MDPTEPSHEQTGPPKSTGEALAPSDSKPTNEQDEAEAEAKRERRRAAKQRQRRNRAERRRQASKGAPPQPAPSNPKPSTPKLYQQPASTRPTPSGSSTQPGRAEHKAVDRPEVVVNGSSQKSNSFDSASLIAKAKPIQIAKDTWTFDPNRKGPTLTSLPAELLNQVAKQLGQRELLALSRTCRKVSEPALYQLYARPQLPNLEPRGRSFVRALEKDPTKGARIVSLTFSEWRDWHTTKSGREEGPLDPLLPFDNLSRVFLGDYAERDESAGHYIFDPDHGVPLVEAFNALAGYGKVQVLSAVVPCVDKIPRTVRRLDSLVELNLYTLLRMDLSLVAKFLPKACPNLRRITYELAMADLYVDESDDEYLPDDRNTIWDSDLDFLDRFASLEEVNISGFVEHLGGKGLVRTVKRLRVVNIRAGAYYENTRGAVTPTPGTVSPDLFRGPHPNLERVCLDFEALERHAPRRLFKSLIAAHLPALRRLKVVLPDPPYPDPIADPASDDEDEEDEEGSTASPEHRLVEKAAQYLRDAGFQVHRCPKVLYAEKPSPDSPVEPRGYRANYTTEWFQGRRHADTDPGESEPGCYCK